MSKYEADCLSKQIAKQAKSLFGDEYEKVLDMIFDYDSQKIINNMRRSMEDPDSTFSRVHRPILF